MKISTTRTTKIDPAVQHSLTAVQAEVFGIIKKRHGKVTTRADIEAAAGSKDKSWICRILKSLIAKGLVERYEQRYYRLATTQTKGK